MFGPKGLHFYLLYFRGNAVIGGAPGNEPFFNCPLEGAVEHEVDAVNGGTAQARVAVATAHIDRSMLYQVFVHRVFLLPPPGSCPVHF